MNGNPPPIAIVERITGASYRTLMFVWVTMALGFGAIYFILTELSPENGLIMPKNGRPWDLANSIYFSIITATTVGYGDIIPQGFAKIFVSAQSIVAFFVFAVFVTKLISYRQEIALHQIHKLSFEDVFRNTREGLFIMRKDFDALIDEAEQTQRLSPHSWQNLLTAYREGQTLLEQIPVFYDSDTHLYTIDAKREQLLQEAVHRTLHRINHMLDALSRNGIDWLAHEESTQELRELLRIVAEVTPLWQQKSPSQNSEPFERILHVHVSIHAHLKRALPL